MAQYRQAIFDYSRLIELRADLVEGYLRRGMRRKRLNDLAGARSDFAEVRRLNEHKKNQTAKPSDEHEPE